MGDAARPIIEEALKSVGVETRPGIEIASISQDRVTLRSGEEILTDTVVWCAGMRQPAHPTVPRQVRLYGTDPRR